MLPWTLKKKKKKKGPSWFLIWWSVADANQDVRLADLLDQILTHCLWTDMPSMPEKSASEPLFCTEYTCLNSSSLTDLPEEPSPNQHPSFVLTHSGLCVSDFVLALHLHTDVWGFSALFVFPVYEIGSWSSCFLLVIMALTLSHPELFHYHFLLCCL